MEKTNLSIKLFDVFAGIKKVVNRIRFLNSGLQQRILYFFVGLIFVPTLIILFFTYNLYVNFMSEKVRIYTYQIVKEISKNIDSNLKIYANLSMQIYANKDVIENMKKEYKDFSEQFEIEKSIKEVLRSLVNYDNYVISVYLIASDGTKYIDGVEFPDNDQRLEYAEMAAAKAEGRLEWIPSERMKSYFGKDYFIFNAVREIKTVEGTKVGTLALMLREDFFEDIYKDVYFGDNAKKMVVSEDLVVVSSMDKDIVGKKLEYQYLRKAVEMKEGTFIQKIGVQKYLIVFSSSRISGWTFISVIPMNELLKEVHDVRNIMLLIIVLFIVFVLVLSYFFSKRITMPVKKLLAAIKKVEEGCFTVEINNNNNDEVGNLSRSFESMVRRVHELLLEIREKEKLKSRAELAALQSQINPHFMYNTLNSIKWMAILNKQENIKNMVGALINLLKNAAKNNEELITIREEVELLKSYTFVQSVRFTNFKTIYNIPEEFMDYKIMKFTLQPIVENSIIHGFGNSDRSGEIIISMLEKDEKLFIEVKDNGIGMKHEEVIGLLTKENDKRYNKMGISNVHNRIVLNYGEGYGLQISSIFGRGTIVTIVLPVIK